MIKNNYIDLLHSFREGATAVELEKNLQALITSVRDTGKGGSLDLRIIIKPAATGNAVLVVEDKITLKAPVPPRDKAIYYATDDNLLIRDNPNQTTLPFKTVEKAAVEIKDIKSPNAAAAPQ